ncbi:hypothetical protein VMCG_05221 [Cytospora schulzeri]|uniref:Uncharacterized protein n=1 Tax=Cytospora schulzeri TaxID=448051 RepID=A0A423WQW9_9PEZI|nr:hypothetical protein VMCG_05221 [Valsa malicola]
MGSIERDEMESFVVSPRRTSTSITDKQHLADKTNTSLYGIHESSTYTEDDQPTDPSSPDERKASVSVKSLTSEILSLLLATASLIALVVLLKEYENNSSPLWSIGNWGVTLNAVVSIISIIFRGTLLMPVARAISQFSWIWFTQPKPLRDLATYDAASRGTIGSIRLLFKLRFMHFASVGATVMVASLALGPFFQQSVQYVSQGVIDTSKKAQAVTAYSWGANIPHGSEYAEDYVTIPYNMKAAIQNGLLSPNVPSTPSPPFSCPTGNCTWDPFATLAFGTQCEDIKSHVQIECYNEAHNGEECHFKPRGDDALVKMLNDTSGYTVLLMQSGLPTRMKNSSSAVRPYLNNTASLALVQWVMTTSDAVITPTSSFEAVRCNFYLSAREVLPKVVNGEYSEQLLQEVSRPEPVKGLNYTDDDFPYNYFLDPFRWEYGDYGPIVYRLNGSTPSNLGKTYTFELNGREFSTLSSQFEGDLLDGMLVTGSGGVPQGTNTLTMLWQADNTTRSMYNMAEAITIEMRANSSNILQQAKQDASLIAPEQAIDGQVWVQQQTVVVRWTWLILPIVLLVLAALSLLAAVLETRRKRVGLWGSSPLTLFFHARPTHHGAHENLVSDAASLNTADAMQKAASFLTARIPRHDRRNIEIYPRASVGGISRDEVKLMPRDSLEVANPDDIH